MKATALSWSSGKDAAFALLELQHSKEFNIKTLFCILDQEKTRVSMHGIRETLINQQARALGIPLHKTFMPQNISMEKYEEIMKINLELMKEKGIKTLAFGDILLEDLKEYRAKQLAALEMKAVFPLWQKDTTKLAYQIIESGLKAIVVSTNAKLLDNSFVGRSFNKKFLSDLPDGIDPCGENGEFHTFVYDGPNFKFPIVFDIGKIEKRNYTSDSDNDDKPTWDTAFWFCDLLPK